MNRPGHNSVAMTSLDIDILVDELEKRGEAWADADAAADALEDSRKSVLAECLLSVNAKTVGEREALALTAPKYTAHLKAKEIAKKAANRARVLYDTQRVKIELLRTNASTARAAMTMR